jgi:light-regulated signal transduction histidine kinase (bacteriophytochrome)
MMAEVNAALRRSNADLQHFAYSASHDLQEPLRMVASFSELLQRKFGGQLGSVGDDYIRRIVEGAKRMDTLLRDLRIFTQVSTQDQDPTEDLDANKVLQISLANLAAAIEESGAAIVSTALPPLRMHEFELEQILQNLIGNAIRYRGDESPKIEIAAVCQHSNWLFSVKDNGIGIAREFQEEIFGMFKRLHGVAEYPGTGMGLAICQRIIERTGGRIWVESELGRGSTFYFTVPFERPKPKRF